jgi:hypothetical protein
MEQDIIEEIEKLRFEIEENGQELKKVYNTVEAGFLCLMVVGFGVGYGLNLTTAIWLAIGGGIFFYIYLPIYREGKRTKKTQR